MEDAPGGGRTPEEAASPAEENEIFLRREAEFAQKHKNDTDEDLIRYLRSRAEALGRVPKKREVVGFTYLKSRFGPWPRVLEKAGLKEPKKEGRRDKRKS